MSSDFISNQAIPGLTNVSSSDLRGRGRDDSSDNTLRLVELSLEQNVVPIEGVKEVRVMHQRHRDGLTRHKVFIILATHDLDRDRKIVEVMTQIDGVSYDLVPAETEDFIPDGASPLKK